MSDAGDVVDLRLRLSALRSSKRRMVAVIGSGLSNSVIPDVARMVELFRDELSPEGRRRFDDVVEPAKGSPLAYQNAASIVKRQVGDQALARAIRKAVLHAETTTAVAHRAEVANDLERCQALEAGGAWTIPDGYRALARFYASLDGAARGPIITTNFDPLIELALRAEGLVASSVPVAYDTAPTADQLRDHQGVPVVHIHGHWTKHSTLSTIAQLTKARPALDGMLRHTFLRSSVLVIGYGGWEDAFMRSLAERALSSDLDLLDAEVLWSAYDASEEKVITNDTLARLHDAPLFNLYLGVDAAVAFDDPPPAPAPAGQVHGAAEPADAVPSPAPAVPTSPPEQGRRSDQLGLSGWNILPVAEPGLIDARAFVDGHQPSWADAATDAWPMISSARELHSLTMDLVQNRRGGQGVVAIGPMGEGKSLALRQVAARVASSTPDCLVLFRTPGAARMTAEFFDGLRRSGHSYVLICADDADLVVDELSAAQPDWSEPDSGIGFLLASQDRLWWRRGTVVTSAMKAVIFHGLEREDSLAIAESWQRYGIMPTGQSVVEDVAEQLVASSSALATGPDSTLFGAVLDVRYGDSLVSRVADLLDRLASVRIDGTGTATLAQIYGGVCLLQDTFDPSAELSRGAHRAVIAAMVGLPGVYADGKILDLLGREAAISYAGDRVYARHASIARAVIEVLRSRGELSEVARLVAQAGGRLRIDGGLERSWYVEPYRLGKGLRGKDEALAAGMGAIEGANEHLEPRVTYLSILRRHHSDRASSYAAALAPKIDDFVDRGSAIRAFLVEYSIISRVQGEAYLSLGLASLAAHAPVGFALDRQRARYVLVSLINSGERLAKANRQRVIPTDFLPSLFVLYERLEGTPGVWEHVHGIRPDVDQLEVARSKTVGQLTQKVATVLQQPALGAIETTKLPITLPAGVQLSDLARLAGHVPATR